MERVSLTWLCETAAYEDQATFVCATIDMVNRMRGRLGDCGGTVHPWRTASDAMNVTDFGQLAFGMVNCAELSSDTPNPLNDWITLWNPQVVNLYMDVMKDHIEGLDELRATLKIRGVEVDSLRVSRAIIKACWFMRRYVIMQEKKDAYGEILVEARRLDDI